MMNLNPKTFAILAVLAAVCASTRPLVAAVDNRVYYPDYRYGKEQKHLAPFHQIRSSPLYKKHVKQVLQMADPTSGFESYDRSHPAWDPTRPRIGGAYDANIDGENTENYHIAMAEEKAREAVLAQLQDVLAPPAGGRRGEEAERYIAAIAGGVEQDAVLEEKCKGDGEASLNRAAKYLFERFEVPQDSEVRSQVVELLRQMRDVACEYDTRLRVVRIASGNLVHRDSNGKLLYGNMQV